MADTTEQQQPQVDDAPISPVQRKNSLENHLQHRPERSELIEIRPPNRKHPPSLNRSARPPSPSEGGESSHHAQPFAALEPHLADVPPLQLQKHMLEDKLNDKISHRPDPEELIKEGVLHDDPRVGGQGEAAKKYEEAMEDEYAKREGGA
ncbi:hypothetical protein FZEAL_8395 [Fusarium zealandicum]|uniref:RPEL repeat protein n=1 Tax=Fusarium zealandicum TaxID=1053134 RepID=A0A8H4UE99_9HYPO|nr:hypothetical protein FZEAL_8395 [Fusarium zealandicum]